MKRRSESFHRRKAARPGPARRHLRGFVFWAAAALLSGRLTADDRGATLVKELKGKSIPVEVIELKGDAITARLVYGPGAEKTSAGTEEEMLFLFSRMAESFAESKRIILDMYMGPERISQIEVETAAALGYSKGQKTASELLGSARMAAHLDVEKTMGEEIAPRTPEEEPHVEALPEKIIPGSERRAAGAAPGGSSSGGGGGRVARPSQPAFPPFFGLLAFLIAGSGLIIVLLMRRRGPTGRSPAISAGIEVVYQDGGRKSFEIRSARTAIGRAKDNHLVLHDPGVSSHHAEIAVSGGAFILRDLASANGVFLNGEKIQEAPLYRGDEVVLGTTRLMIGA